MPTLSGPQIPETKSVHEPSSEAVKVVAKFILTGKEVKNIGALIVQKAICKLAREGKVSATVSHPKGTTEINLQAKNYDSYLAQVESQNWKIVGYKVLEKSETIRETDDSKDIANSKDAINLARNKAGAFIKALGTFSGKREETRFVNSFIKENEELSTEIMSEIALSLNDFFVQGLGSTLSVAVLNTGEKPTFVSGQEFLKLIQNSGSARIMAGELKILSVKNTPINPNPEKQLDKLLSPENYQNALKELSTNTNSLDLNSLFDPTFDENIKYSKFVPFNKGQRGNMQDFIIRIPKEQKRQILIDLLNKGGELGNMDISTYDSSGKPIGGFDIPPDLNKFINTFLIEYSPRIKCQLRIATPREKK